jgi:tetratricopeptide (TPR) repeat protein
MRAKILALLAGALLSACAGDKPVAAPTPPTSATVSDQIITQKTDGTAADLRRRARLASQKQDWKEVALALEALRTVEPSAALLLELGDAYDSLGERSRASACYMEAADKFPDAPQARFGLYRAANLLAFAAKWKELAAIAERIRQVTPEDTLSKVTFLGARGLARIEQGDDDHGMHDIQDGLDLADTIRLGSAGRVPAAMAQLWFGLGEARRIRSEKIIFDQKDNSEFMPKFEARCSLLLSAQSALADAIRSEDPRWAAMSGVRVGEMYRLLHKSLMAMPNLKANTEDKQQLYFAMMHVRYRVLLEKGGDMMDRTLGLAEKLTDTFREQSTWIENAKTTKVEIQEAIRQEKEVIAKLPYTEAEVQKALDNLRQKVIDQQEKEAKAREKKAGK